MVAIFQNVPPLDWQTPIVDPVTGKPTPQFILLWQRLFQNGEFTNEEAADAIAGLEDKADKVITLTAGTALSGGGDLSANRTFDHDDSAVTPGSYTNADITVDAQGHITAADNGTGGGGVPAPSVRASSITSSSASSYVITFPTGAITGDLVIVFVGGGWNVASTTPNTWNGWVSLTGSNWNGYVAYRYLTAADVATGSVTINMGGTFNTVLAAVTIESSPELWPYIAAYATRFGTGSTTRQLITDGSIRETDLVLMFGSVRSACDVTIDVGTQLQAVNATDASGALYSLENHVGGISPTYSYPTAGTGNFQCVIRIRFYK